MPPTQHLIFVFADHFEPRQPEQMAAWVRGYPTMAERPVDADGCPPRHTWFYDGDDPEVLDQLGGLARRGLGEIELHLHHGHDTAESLTDRIEQVKARFAQHGALVCVGDPQRTAYGITHGKWGLCNSRGPRHCGVNGELAVLRRTGCYADFTFPAWGRMNPRKRNSIYYAADNPDRPKAYDDGIDVEVGREPTGDLMIFQGPGDMSGLPARVARRTWLRDLLWWVWLFTDVTDLAPATPRRVDGWVRRHVHVRGRGEWTFVKVQTHGARAHAFDACFGERAAALHSYLAERYNDGDAWRLHYATAREACNMVKAAERGKSGDPGQCRDFEIGPYQNTR